jgi:aminoglycoside phosphotransferase (APT) family kinase protein
MLKSAARAYASFVEALNDLDIESAFEPIRDFHGMEFRIKQLEDAKHNNLALAKSCLLEIMAIEELITIISPLIIALQSGELPTRMVHNDTKINNLLFDESHEARCVVDLDTVMPGSVVYDVGDALRTICSNLPEDDPSVDQLIIDVEAADIFIEAYQAEAVWLVEGERKWLHLSPVYMSLIMGIRFLTDYLQGDVYFHTARTGHNLDRARNQIKLAQLFADRT